MTGSPALYALADLHLGHPTNRQALEEIPDHGDAGLILAGDVGESVAHLERAFDALAARFGRLFWVPGNHELWTVDSDAGAGGEAKYRNLVDCCRAHGVLTPEDPFHVWPSPDGPVAIALLATLYDYTFRPDEIPADAAIDWARETGVVCADEIYLKTAPHASITEWCHRRCRETEARLEALDPALPTVLVNHWPLRADLAVLPRIPRFSIWCGTRRTGDWARRFRAQVVVYGHLHIRKTRRIDGVRFEESSLGYPRQWQRERGIAAYLREIYPAWQKVDR